MSEVTRDSLALEIAKRQNKRIARTNTKQALEITRLTQDNERLRELLKTLLPAVIDYWDYKWSGDPYEEDARQMGEMELDRLKRNEQASKTIRDMHSELLGGDDG